MAKNLNVAGTTNIATNLNVQKITTLGTNVNPTPTPLVVRGSANIGNQIAASVATFTGQTTTKTLVVNAGASCEWRAGGRGPRSSGCMRVAAGAAGHGCVGGRGCGAHAGRAAGAALLHTRC